MKIKKQQEELKLREEKLENEQEIYRKISEKDRETILKVMNMDLLRSGLANYPDEEFAKEVGKNINSIVNWQVEQLKEKIDEKNKINKDKKEETI